MIGLTNIRSRQAMDNSGLFLVTRVSYSYFYKVSVKSAIKCITEKPVLGQLIVHFHELDKLFGNFQTAPYYLNKHLLF